MVSIKSGLDSLLGINKPIPYQKGQTRRDVYKNFMEKDPKQTKE